MSNPFMTLIVILIGGFSIFCAYKDYDWFMNNSKARFWVKVLGRDGARKFYMGLGAFIIAVGVVLCFTGF